MKVTKAHYVELQKRLKEQNPDRDLPEYEARKHNVQSVKLDLLRSITPDHNEDRVDDDPEASKEEDGLEINPFFPFTLTFLDLSTLGLKNKNVMSDRFPLPLFLRQDYDYISTLIKKEP